MTKLKVGDWLEVARGIELLMMTDGIPVGGQMQIADAFVAIRSTAESYEKARRKRIQEIEDLDDAAAKKLERKKLEDELQTALDAEKEMSVPRISLPSLGDFKGKPAALAFIMPILDR